jgi:2-haloacid dehalogenase
VLKTQGEELAIEAFVFDVYGTLFDTQSVVAAVEKIFPAHADYITQVWRQKQLEYSWQRAAMGFYADFSVVTREALAYALATVTSDIDEAVISDLCRAFERLTPFAETPEALAALSSYRLAILSNGSPAMLASLLEHSGLRHHFEQVISTDLRRTFKPHPDFYRSAASTLGLPPEKIMLVSSNGFDIAGAKHYGLSTMRIERLPAGQLRDSLANPAQVAPRLLFGALRSQPEAFGSPPDFTCRSLADLAALAPSIAIPTLSSPT